MCNPRKSSGARSRAAVVAAVFGAVMLRDAAAQATTFHACYVPTVGAMYMIKLSGVPPACLSTAHVEISWTDSGGVANGSVTTAKLADGAVTTIKLAAAAVGSAQVLDGSLTGADLAAGAVGTSQIANGAVNTINLAAGAVTNSTIAAQAVNPTKILDGSVTRAKLGSDAFTAIAWGFVNSDGTLGTHSANVTATWNAGASRNEITITGESYFFSNYATVVSPSLPTPLTTMLIPNVASFQGKLHVQLLSSAGASMQGHFQFVTLR